VKSEEERKREERGGGSGAVSEVHRLADAWFMVGGGEQ
jgi:hypothetical protein